MTVEQRAAFGRWIDAYERAWRTPGTVALEGLFTSAATYVAAPFDPPLVGRSAIADFWEAQRQSADEVFVLASDLVAVDGDVAVARVEVRYGEPQEQVYRDLWIITLDATGRCSAFEEWPFFPGRPRDATGHD